MRSTLFLSPIAILLLTAACGGGATSTAESEMAPVEPPQTFSSDQIPQLAAYAEGGNREVVKSGGSGNEIMRFERDAVVDAKPVTVSFTRFHDTDAGVVRIREGNDIAAYQLTGQGNAAPIPSGAYSGQFEADYRLSAIANERNRVGSADATVDVATGDIDYELRAGNILIDGDSAITQGSFSDGAATVIVSDDQGTQISTETGIVSGITANNADGAGIIGTATSGGPGGFEMNGGFVMTQDGR